jgi:small subunit ribosomal protein S11
MAKEAGRANGQRSRPRSPRERKNIASGVAHVNASFNNTMITITDAQGNTIAWSSARHDGLQGLAQVDAVCRAGRRRRRRPKAQEHGMRTLEVEVAGPGSGRESALRALQAAASP